MVVVLAVVVVVVVAALVDPIDIQGVQLQDAHSSRAIAIQLQDARSSGARVALQWSARRAPVERA